MEINRPNLLIEISDKNFIFIVVKYNEDLDFEILDSLVVKSDGVLDGKIVDAKISSKILRDNINLIEKKIDFSFQNATVINCQENFSCINISGYKNLRGSQVSREDISYILNDVKKTISENEPNKSIIHLFNSNFYLDNSPFDQLPLGLHGEFYNHHLTFFLLPKNDLKNLKLVLSNSNINIERVILKSFSEGLKMITDKNNNNNFIMLNIGKKKSNISIFNNLSFIYYESFNFGTDIIMSDISKVCSLKNEIVKKIFNEINFDEISTRDNEYLNKKYFNGEIRKISISHLHDIISSRIEEIMNITFNKNVNIRNIIKNDHEIYFCYEDSAIIKNYKNIFNKYLSGNFHSTFNSVKKNQPLEASIATANLIGKGWKKEAIPLIQNKKSLISRIFNTIFN